MAAVLRSVEDGGEHGGSFAAEVLKELPWLGGDHLPWHGGSAAWVRVRLMVRRPSSWPCRWCRGWGGAGSVHRGRRGMGRVFSPQTALLHPQPCLRAPSRPSGTPLAPLTKQTLSWSRRRGEAEAARWRTSWPGLIDASRRGLTSIRPAEPQACTVETACDDDDDDDITDGKTTAARRQQTAPMRSSSPTIPPPSVASSRERRTARRAPISTAPDAGCCSNGAMTLSIYIAVGSLQCHNCPQSARPGKGRRLQVRAGPAGTGIMPPKMLRCYRSGRRRSLAKRPNAPAGRDEGGQRRRALASPAPHDGQSAATICGRDGGGAGGNSALLRNVSLCFRTELRRSADQEQAGTAVSSFGDAEERSAAGRLTACREVYRETVGSAHPEWRAPSPSESSNIGCGGWTCYRRRTWRLWLETQRKPRSTGSLAEKVGAAANAARGPPVVHVGSVVCCRLLQELQAAVIPASLNGVGGQIQGLRV
ncbi:hypothetical protein BU16DRAFT_538567 [Lophium mytilinum]|uniref:Uncharacterized protein n=1 Tax=Lophium mytilinum TaxID=390894 RepID=A0A6A6QUT6_9PEZI|nr:hypothetical protein BU16DRAFT_538567 [Lophium mytilinum]